MAFVAVAVLNLSEVGGGAESQPLVDSEQAERLSPPAMTEAIVPGPGNLKVEIERATATARGNVGLALLGANGDILLEHGSDKPFVLASVAKVYILVSYLDKLYQDDEKVDDTDMEILQPMIRVSSNAAATALWERLGEEEGLASFLASKGLPPVGTVEDGAWGTLNVTAAQVAELLWMLQSGQLLDPESTQLAMRLLSDIDEEQDWGISAGASEPGTVVRLKNGWYPEVEGWRVNSAGTVQTPGEDYVLVVLSDSAASFEEGVELVEDLSERVNAFMTSRKR